jgi:hypothetical protein
LADRARKAYALDASDFEDMIAEGRADAPYILIAMATVSGKPIKVPAIKWVIGVAFGEYVVANRGGRG